MPFAIAIALSALIIGFELETGNMPNAITLGLLFVAGCMGILDMKLLSHFGGFAMSALVCIVLYRQDALGGGSVKWTVALCTLLGARDGALMMFVAGLTAGPAYFIARRRDAFASVPTSPFLLVGILVALANVVAERRAWW